jgi:hypothetical protein
MTLKLLKLRFIVSPGLLLLAGCYHATVETGLAPSNVVLDQSFASSWIYGLVPPKTVSTTSRCPDGVAKVETQLSFVNQLVGLLTLGIYTPMHIRVTCAMAGAASSGAMLDVPAGAADTVLQAAFGRAATLAAGSHRPVMVRFVE